MSVAYAAPASLVDDTAAGATNDGTIAAGEYPASSSGINNGFGDVIGGQSTLSVDSDVLGNLFWALDSVGQLNDVVVIYIDSSTGGYNSTSTFTDTADNGRRAISGTDGTNRSELTFAPGFEADYAVLIESGFAGLFAIRPTNHVFIRALTVNAPVANDRREVSGMTLGDLGLDNFGEFDYVATLINPTNAFRSDEFQGVASTSVPSGNPGNSAVNLSAGDFNTFTPVVVQINEVDADQTGTDSEEFIELVTAPATVDLSGLILVAYNGTNDESYDTIDLAGQFSGADALFVAGSLDVPNVDLVVGNTTAPASTNLLQNGPDGVALYLADASSFPSGTPATSTNLVDALVYETADADAATLLSILTPGEPQIDEAINSNSATESSQRCGDGLRTSSNFVVAPTTPGAVNDCPTPCMMQSDCSQCEVCDVTQNICVPATAGTSCDLDSNQCTTDSCDGAGVCTSGGTVQCPADDVCQSFVCEPTTGSCQAQNTNEGLACDDGDACTTGSTCSSGTCSGGTNTCQCQTNADCASFEDGDLCNGTLICDANNQCVVDTSTVVTCDSANDTTCIANTCDPSTGTCSMQPTNEAGACDDGNECTTSDVCASGTCTGMNVADDTACDLDSDACTQDSCQGGTCTAGGLVDCSNLDDTCVVGVCDPADGSCSAETAAEGTECDDGNVCTENDACDSNGTCVADSVPDGSPCDDGDMCTDPDSCMSGVCEAGGNVCPADMGMADAGSDMGSTDMGDQVDMGMPGSDMGMASDMAGADTGALPGVKDSASDDGCGCRIAAAPRTNATPLFVAFLLVAGLIRVRRMRD